MLFIYLDINSFAVKEASPDKNSTQKSQHYIYNSALMNVCFFDVLFSYVSFVYQQFSRGIS